jgi:dihydroxyacetone kinase-like protein
MKKFVNDPQHFVPEMLEGLALANPDTLKYVPDYNLIMRSDAPARTRCPSCRAPGSGHEPAHVMIVGRACSTPPVPGDVFAAPPMDYVYETTKLLASPKGVLLLVNNYTGDRMAFDMGKEMAESEGIRVEILTINDDVAVKDSLYTIGRAASPGTSSSSRPSARPRSRARPRRAPADRQQGQRRDPHHGRRADRLHSAVEGLALFELGADEIEMGVGIHGEPGRERKAMASADAIVDELLDAVVTDLPYASGDRVALMVNGLGGTPISELYILYRRAHQQLAERGITVGRSYVTSTALPRHGRCVADPRPARRRDRRPARAPRQRCPSACSDRPPRLQETVMARLLTLDQANAIVAACTQEAAPSGSR